MRQPPFALHVALGACLAFAPKGLARTTQAPADQVQEVDAKAFLVAFRHGDAARYDGFRVTGSGADFHGVKVESNGAYAMTRLVLTAGRLADDDSITPITDWVAQDAANRLSRALDVVLKVPSLIPPGPARRYPPSMYQFSGLYLSEVETLTRLTVGPTPRLAPCRPLPQHTTPWRLPAPSAPSGPVAETPTTTAYCAPVLVNASVK